MHQNTEKELFYRQYGFLSHILTIKSGVMPLITFSVDRFASGVLVAIDLFKAQLNKITVRKE
jgi:hypothetical protein